MKHNYGGFTLIEVLIVVAIIGILAGIAYPSYQSYILKSRRVEAKEALTALATQQERWFFQYNQYSTDPDSFGFKEVGSNFYTTDDHYQISITDDPCDDDGCYTATATAVGAQLKDESCRKFSIRQNGHKQSWDKHNNENTSTANCW